VTLNLDADLYTYKISVVSVHDGDTFLANIDVGFNMTLKDHIRVYDVDCPELHGATYDAANWARVYTELWLRGCENLYYAQKVSLNQPWIEDIAIAHPYLTSLYIESKEFNPREKYGRILAKVYRPNKGYYDSLATMLTAEGLIK
jgi:endonuclease YncB( thermonuclease family)